jgi:hypothetical protein
VPVAGIPLIADQLDNVMKAVHRGFGLAIDPRGGLKAADIGAALRRLLGEPGFAAAAAKLRRRLRARPRTPAQEAAGALRLPPCPRLFSVSALVRCPVHAGVLHEASLCHAGSCEKIC